MKAKNSFTMTVEKVQKGKQMKVKIHSSKDQLEKIDKTWNDEVFSNFYSNSFKKDVLEKPLTAVQKVLSKSQRDRFDKLNSGKFAFSKSQFDQILGRVTT